MCHKMTPGEYTPMRRSSESKQRRIAAAQAGCQQALGATLEACRHYLLWIARREIDPDLQAKGGASDLVQETFLEARRDFAQFQGGTEAELLAWLRRLLLNNLSNFVRRYRETAKRRVGDEVSLDALNASSQPARGEGAGSTSPYEQVMHAEQVELLKEAVTRLPEDQRQIIMLWHQEEKSFEEMGRMLGCAPNTVRNKWMKAIKRLQESLESMT